MKCLIMVKPKYNFALSEAVPFCNAHHCDIFVEPDLCVFGALEKLEYRVRELERRFESGC